MLTADRLRELMEYDPETGLFRWRVVSGPRKRGWWGGSINVLQGYAVIGIGMKTYLAHRLAWLYQTGDWPPDGMQIDHINGNRADNRWCNLRIATRAQNQQNCSGRGNMFGLKGVRHHPGRAKPYAAQIVVDRRRQTLGYFKTPEEAHAAYVDAARHHFGEFARA